MSLPPVHVLLVGVSTRALAQSAARAGCEVTAVDAFGDLDQQSVARVVAVRETGKPYSAHRAVRLAETMSADAVAYVSNLENNLPLVARLAERFQLLGNDTQALALARNPLHIMRVLRQAGVAFARVRATAPSPSDFRERAKSRRWLLKPRRSGGGNGVHTWRHGAILPRSAYLQERIDGPVGSIVFAADGSRAVPFGFSRQLCGEPALGVRGFQYCGSLMGHPARIGFGNPDLLRRATEVADVLTAGCGLKGVNGIDFGIRSDSPCPFEVNPRPSASMELAERAFGISVYRLHAEGSLGHVSGSSLEEMLKGGGVYGKAVVHAREAVKAGDTRRWLDDANISDIPHAGERFSPGQPVCTVFATGRDAETCRTALLRRAERIYGSMKRSARSSA
ncbi:MAG: ATP-grasp domain-containing protein [Gemmatimonadota bacterium]